MNELIKDFYNRSAPEFDKEQEEFGFVRVPEREISLGVLRSVAGRGDSILEIGAGTGRFTLEMAPLVSRMVAVDISPQMLKVMSDKMTERKITNVRQICGSFLETDFEGPFDVIMSFSAIEYIKDSKALFRKISGLLKPGGHLILSTAHDTFLRFWGRLGNYFRQGIYLDAYSKGRMKRLLAENGLRIEEVRDLCLKNLFFRGILLFVHAVKTI
jgi:2-polyprenyl-3-methyl-5-hydroxy-6-metoxy-1,4-benzoquinol methylase